jgi:hypothetical protein
LTISFATYSVLAGKQWTLFFIDVKFQRPPSRNSPRFMVYHHVHKGPTLVVFQNQINPVHVIPSYCLKTHFDIQLPSLVRLVFPIYIFLSGFTAEILHVSLFSLIRATCPANLLLRDLITLIILDKEYKNYAHPYAILSTLILLPAYSDKFLTQRFILKILISSLP